MKTIGLTVFVLVLGSLSYMPTVSALCGNGIAEPPEQCDDGNFENNDGCNIPIERKK